MNISNDNHPNNPVYTPTPPQVIDPSQPLKKEDEEVKKHPNQKNKTRKKKSSGEKMPSEKS